MTRPAFAAKVYDSLSGRGGHFKAGNGTDKQAAFVTPCISLGVRYFKPRWKKTPVYTHVIENMRAWPTETSSPLYVQFLA